MNIRCVWAQLVPLLTVAIMLFSVRAVGQAPPRQGGDETTSVETVTADWGQMFNGLQVRVGSPISVVSEELMELNLEFRITSDSLESQIDKVVLLPPEATATLNVFNEIAMRQTQHTWRQHSLSGSSPTRVGAGIAGDTARASIQIKVPTPLVIVESKVRWQLDLFVPAFDSSSWNGFISSPEFDLTLIPKHTEIETLTIVFPRECELLPGPRLGYDSLMMDSAKVEHHKGLCLGRELWSPTGRRLSGWRGSCEAIVTDRDFTLPRTIVFEEGRMNTSHKFAFFETTRCPEHMWSPYGSGYQVLWNRDYLFTVNKAEMDSLTIPEHEQYSYHTFVVPGQVKVSTENEVIAEGWMLTTIESKINRGWEVGYWVSIDGKYTEPFYHSLRSPFYRLPRRPINESPIKFGIVLIQFQRDKLRSDKPNYPGHGQVLWHGNAQLSDTVTSVEMELSEDVRLLQPAYWRQGLIPRHLVIDDNWQIVADASSPIAVDFRQSAGQLPLVRLLIANDTVGYFSTSLPETLYTLDPSANLDSVITLTLSLTMVADSCQPSGKEWPFWSKKYSLEIPRTTHGSTKGGKQDVH